MEITLKHGVARVDDADADLISTFKWWSKQNKRGGCAYAFTKIAGHTVYMHHVVLGHTPKGHGGGDIDHINGDGLDNRRDNLRFATRSQNNANTPSQRGSTSSYKGVSWSEQSALWQVHIRTLNENRYLGSYESEEDAAHAYDIAARDAHGDFAFINFPDRIDEPPPIRFSINMVAREIEAPLETTTTSHWRQGASNGNAKLSEDDVRAIIRELQVVPRRTQVSIAKEFGVSQSMIGYIKRRESWAHLWTEECDTLKVAGKDEAPAT